jgi:hypothetical protein
MIGVAFLVILITVPLIILMNGIIQQNQEDLLIEQVLVESPILEEAHILEIERSQLQEQLVISATIKSTKQLTQKDVDELALTLEAELDQSLHLEIITMPILRSK